MKRFFTYILSIIIFTASFQNSLLMIDYQINRDFYEIHCVNKSKPEMNCHGKCQMKKESDKTSSFVNLVKYSFEFNLIPSKSAEFNLSRVENDDFKKAGFIYSTEIVRLGFHTIDPHPPQI
ncbi:hypothetical protein KSK37_10145 [Kaistella sp. DKR-2]|uniref:hypothetical protein n=1 Tax=Kaistella soli TaxID=2849654 RepID=UPI001C257598|nr:hypothetical protein [Kaistella soli]MBU8883443.1 hypothetical protein [Kaistella soli]